jgi:hypothetical protein
MTDTSVSRWTGWVVFAGVMLLIAGAFDVIYGLVAIVGPNSAYFVSTSGELLFWDVAAWGWWHFISGITLILVGLFVMQGAGWARVTAIVLVALNALLQLSLLPVQPWWSLILLAVDLIVVYALIVHGRELATRRTA